MLGKGQTAGSRAYLERLGVRSRSLVAVFDLEMCGWSRGRPVLHPIAYADPRRAGRQGDRARLARARGARGLAGGRSGPARRRSLSVVAVPARRSGRSACGSTATTSRSCRAGAPPLHGLRLVGFSAFYPDYHEATDTADRLDPAALERMGRAAFGVVRALDRVPAGPADDAHWFAAFGHVIGWPWILGLGALSMLPVAASGLGGGALPVALRFTPAAPVRRPALARSGAGRLGVPAAEPAHAAAPALVDDPRLAPAGARARHARRRRLVAAGGERRLAPALGDRDCAPRAGARALRAAARRRALGPRPGPAGRRDCRGAGGGSLAATRSVLCQPG